MASKSPSATVITPNLVMRGDLKVSGNVELATNFYGSVKARGEVRLAPGVEVEADITSGSLRLDPGSILKGHLQVGEARRPLNRLWNWYQKLGVEKASELDKGETLA